MDESVQLIHSRGGTPAAHRDSQVPLGWTKHLLSDVGHIVTGRTPPGTAEIYFGGEVRFLTPTDMDGRRICDVTSRTLSPMGQEKLKRVLIRSGVAVSCIGWQMGKAILVDRPTVTNQQINTVIPHEGVSADFLYYVLSSRRAEIFALGAGGSRTPILNKSDFGKLQVELPSVNEQEQIVSALKALDRRIELLRAENETLEAMARAIFKSWFVDFDPVRAKAEGREPEGMDAATAALFPSEFQDSELGPIPRGWAVRPIEEICEAVGGSTPSTKNEEYWTDGEFHWVTPKDLSDLKSPILLRTERKLTAAGVASIGSGLLPIGTVLLSSRAPIGYIAIAEIPTAINQGFIAMKANDGISNLYLWLWTVNSIELIKSRANGSTFQEISKKNFRPILLVVPTVRVMEIFDMITRPLYERLVSNDKQRLLLTDLRDTLLPRLISGKLRVPEAEAMLAGAF